MQLDFKTLINPYIHIVLICSVVFLISFDNPLGGLKIYGYFESVSLDIISLYVFSYFLGCFTSKINLNSTDRYNYNIDFKNKWALNLFYLACLFQLLKFLNIGDIPFLGDSMSRYKLTIGGLEDFPSRMLAPVGIILYLKYIKKKKGKYIIASSTCLLLNLLMMQRQEVLIQLFGIFIIHNLEDRITVKKIILFAFMVLTSLYIIVGYGAILRYGGDNISSSIDLFELPLWIVHLELVGSYVLSEHVVAILDGRYLNGLYSFGDYLSLIGIKFEHGAKLIGSTFTERETAQSLGAPYSYFSDFGYVGLVCIGIFNGMFVSYFYNRFKVTNSEFYTVIYILIFLNSLWSIRSGIFLLNTLMLYSIVALVSISIDGKFIFRKYFRAAFVIICFVSLVSAAVRV